MSKDNKKQEKERDSSNRERYLTRRRVLMASGTLAGAGIVMGSSQAQDGQETTPGNETAGNETTTTQGEPEGDTTEGPETVPARNVTGLELEERYTGLEILVETAANAQMAERESVTEFITPATDHYIRNHYPTPEIDASEWTVSLTGLAGMEDAELSMEEIKDEFSTEEVTHTMQCSGNGRAYFDPMVDGNQWSWGALGNTVWTGSPVSEILDSFGADTASGKYLSVMGGDAVEGADIFCRSIPMDKVMNDCLLAYEMNGEPMYPEHGYPVRFIVPGWFGNNNVKWVDRMHVMDNMVFGDEWERYTHWQQSSYRIVPEGEEPNRQQDIDTFDTREQMESDEIRHPYMYDQMVKSVIGYPGENSTVSPGIDGKVEVIGVAWAGDDRVETIQVSADGGETWHEGEFYGPVGGPESWRLFRYKWDADPGTYTLVSKATDERGRTQPATISQPDEKLTKIEDNKYPWNNGGYGATAYGPVAVEVTVVADETETPTPGDEGGGNGGAGGNGKAKAGDGTEAASGGNGKAKSGNGSRADGER